MTVNKNSTPRIILPNLDRSIKFKRKDSPGLILQFSLQNEMKIDGWIKPNFWLRFGTYALLICDLQGSNLNIDPFRAPMVRTDDANGAPNLEFNNQFVFCRDFTYYL